MCLFPVVRVEPHLGDRDPDGAEAPGRREEESRVPASEGADDGRPAGGACLQVKGREGERESVCVCVCVKERERERERERECVCVCVCEGERERECVCVRERERECVCVCVCV